MIFNESQTGFSFIYPPLAHLRLGDWFNNDIVINSISYVYDEAPWTLDGLGRVQPMWANVTMQFNIVGPWGRESGVPPTSTWPPRGGFFQAPKNIT